MLLCPMLVVEISIHSRRFGYSYTDLTARLRGQDYQLFEIGALPLRRFEDDAMGNRVYLNVIAAREDRLEKLARAGVIAQ